MSERIDSDISYVVGMLGKCVCWTWTCTWIWTSSWKKFIQQNKFCTLCNSSQSKLLSRQETLIKVHMHRLHKGHQRSWQMLFHYHPMFMFTCFDIYNMRTQSQVPLRFVRKYSESIRPVDDETKFACDSRYKMSIFSHKLVVETGLHAELNMYYSIIVSRSCTMNQA